MIYNSTIISKRKVCVSCGNKNYIFSRGMCKQCATVKSTTKRIAKHEEAEEDLSVQYLVSDLDAIFSRYIRLLYADEKGIVDCYTCGIRLPINEIQNGHYIHRADYATRWLPDNCKPQCEPCNSKHNDSKEPYRSKLEREQNGITDYLLNLSREVYKPTREELKSLIAEYRHKVSILKRKIKV
jgi:hypothetical protein